MYSFPDKLYREPTKMFFDEDMFAGFPDGGSICYSRYDGNWSDVGLWEWVDGSKRLPGEKDVVYVRHGLNINTSSSCFHLFNTGNITWANGSTLTISGEIKSSGIINMNGNSCRLTLNGLLQKSYINNFSTSSTGRVYYSGASNQIILPIDYNNLYVTNEGIKIANANLTVNGALEISNNGGTVITTLEIGNYNAYLNSVKIWSKGNFSCNGGGNIIISGLLFIAQTGAKVSFSGNPSIELRGGITYNSSSSSVNFGNKTIRFTTNNQTISIHLGPLSISNDIEIVGNITVTNDYTASNGDYLYVNSVEGTTALSTFANVGFLGINTSDMPMQTNGVFDVSPSTNTLLFSYNGDLVLPFVSYEGNVVIGGTGIKTLSANTVINNGLTINNNGTLTVAYDLEIGGVTQNSGTLNVTTSSYLKFGDTLNSTGNIDFSGNPSVEFLNGYSIGLGDFSSGTGQWKFTTNNQTIGEGNTGKSFNSDFLISGPITVTHNSISSCSLSVENINGDDPDSVLDNYQTINYTGASAPMTIGQLQSETGSYFGYLLSGNQEIKEGTYYNLEFGGSGVKKLMGNIIVDVTNGGSWSITGTATIDYNGFTITEI